MPIYNIWLIIIININPNNICATINRARMLRYLPSIKHSIKQSISQYSFDQSINKLSACSETLFNFLA